MAEYRVYVYGVARGPVVGEEQAVGIMRVRNQLWNTFIEIERTYLATREKAIGELAPELLEAEMAIAEMEGKGPEAKEARRQFRELRKKVLAREEVQILIKELTTGRVEAVKAAYHVSGLYWGNYLEVLTDYERARKRPGQLQFHSWQVGTGKVSIRYERGIPTAKILAGDTRLQIDPVPTEAHTSTSRAIRRHTARTIARIRLGSVTARQPIWLEIPIIYHRPLPEGLVRHASMIRERVGLSYRWKLVVTIQLPEERVMPEPKGRGRVALDMGWRRVPEGLRVAMWADDGGRWGDLVLSDRWLTAMHTTRDLRSIRDQNANLLRTAVSEWISRQSSLPEWIREETATIALWRSSSRLWRLAQRWERFEGDGEIWEILQAWVKKERHLYSYESNLRDQLIADRRERYRVFASRLCRDYREIVHKETDLKQLGEAAGSHRGWQRTEAAVSVLIAAISNAASREGLTLTERDPAYTTQRCHICGYTEPFNAAEDILHQCRGCGAKWDQDLNAARNLLREPADPKESAHKPRELDPVGAETV